MKTIEEMLKEVKKTVSLIKTEITKVKPLYGDVDICLEYAKEIENDMKLIQKKIVASGKLKRDDENS